MTIQSNRRGNALVIVNVILAVVVLGALGWSAMLQKRVKDLEGKIAAIEKTEAPAAGKRTKTAAPAAVTPPVISEATTPATTQSARRGRRGPATAPSTTQAVPAKPADPIRGDGIPPAPDGAK